MPFFSSLIRCGEYEDEGTHDGPRHAHTNQSILLLAILFFYSLVHSMYVHIVCMRVSSSVVSEWVKLLLVFRLVRLIWILRFSKLHIVFFIWRVCWVRAMRWHGNWCGNSAFSWGMCSAFHIDEHASRLAHLIGRLSCWTGVTRSSKYLLSICNLCVVGILTHTYTYARTPSTATIEPCQELESRHSNVYTRTHTHKHPWNGMLRDTHTNEYARDFHSCLQCALDERRAEEMCSMVGIVCYSLNVTNASDVCAPKQDRAICECVYVHMDL